jgi:hypothetical protein
MQQLVTRTKRLRESTEVKQPKTYYNAIKMENYWALKIKTSIIYYKGINVKDLGSIGIIHDGNRVGGTKYFVQEKAKG